MVISCHLIGNWTKGAPPGSKTRAARRVQAKMLPHAADGKMRPYYHSARAPPNSNDAAPEIQDGIGFRYVEQQLQAAKPYRFLNTKFSG